MPSTLATVVGRTLLPPDSTARRVFDAVAPKTNLDATERWVSLAGGGLLAALGLTKTTPPLLSLLAGGYLLYRAASGNCPVYQLMGVNHAAPKGSRAVVPAGHGSKVECVTTVNKPPAECYRFWRDLENLPRFMKHLEDVDTTSDGKSRWIATGPLGLRVQWEAELTADEPNKQVAWKSLPGGDVDTAGSVHFVPAPGDRGTEVRVSLKYDPPGGAVGTLLAKLFGEDPKHSVKADLSRFKSILEAGEVATNEGQSSGRK